MQSPAPNGTGGPVGSGVRQNIKRQLKRCLPRSIRNWLRDLVFKDDTVARGWDRWARLYSGQQGGHLGDEWSDPEELGLELPPDQFPRYLYDEVFYPFLGPTDVLLEIGPGGGRFTELLVVQCDTLIAADTSPAMLKRLQERFSDQHRIDYIQLDGRGLSQLPDASIDAAFSYDVFIHLPQWDVYNYLCELRRVMRSGGRAIIHHANTFSTLGWKQFCREVPVSVGKHKPFNTFSVMTPELMTGFAQRAGLRVQDCLTDVVPRDCITLLEAP